jgi:tetratricopeptide (TPR) repeat protein
MAEGGISPVWTLSTAPQVVLPLLGSDFSGNELFSTAWGGSLGASLAMPDPSPLAFCLGLAYARCGLLSVGEIEVPGSLDELVLSGGLQLRTRLAPRLDLHGNLDAGLGYGFLSSGVSAPYAVVGLGGGLGYSLAEDWNLSLDLGGVYKFGLYGGASLGLGLGYRLPEPTAPAAQPRLRLLDFTKLSLDPVFPVLRSYYDEGALGSLCIRNTGRQAALDVHVSVYIRQYMDAPKECAVIARIDPGKSVELPLHALFNDVILSVTEATKVAAEVSVAYRGGELARTATVIVYDRNALTWTDDRIASAFVSSKDPWVLDLSGNILAAAKGAWNAELPKNLETGIAFHEGLRTYGMSYVLSPNRPFAVGAADKGAVDSLKFPRQSLGYRSGDCADLSVLYASFFEAAGIETAFVTVPGHIFMAFDLGISEEEARARSMDTGDLIIRDGRVWVPVETTMRDSGFLEVWKKAAAEWRASSSAGTAAFYPVHDAWSVYAPVGLPADGSTVSLPSKDALLKGFRAELAKAVDAELGARLAAAKLAAGKAGDAAKAANDLGILYGKYGRYAEAQRQFELASDLGLAAATINLGNVALLKGDYAGALAAYQKAAKASPSNARILVNLARAAAGLGKTDLVNSTLASLRSLDPTLADQYAGLSAESQGAQGARAASMDDDGLLWF